MKKTEMKPYTEFVKNVLDCISESFPAQQNKLNLFAEKDTNHNYSGTQEYAILRNDEARFFHSALTKNIDLFDVDLSNCILKESKLCPGEVKIVHRCYPKNLRRWLNGTISRKKSCRVEFCILAWCHAVKWNPSFEEEQIELYDGIQNKLLYICNEYLTSPERQLSVEVLWKASCNAYYKSFKFTSRKSHSL